MICVVWFINCINCQHQHRKRTTTNNNNNDVTTTIKNNITRNIAWEEIARLTTKGDPVTKYLDQFHIGISIEENVVFIGRYDVRDYSKVFVYDLTNVKN